MIMCWVVKLIYTSGGDDRSVRSNGRLMISRGKLKQVGEISSIIKVAGTLVPRINDEIVMKLGFVLNKSILYITNTVLLKHYYM
jgi:hypothetical protein